jgi:hypothetical protein
MELTLFLGKVLGIIWVVMGLALIIHNVRFKKLFTEICDKPVYIAMTGYVNLLIGTLLVVMHNYWSFSMQGVVTLIGWLIFLGAVMRFIMPDYCAKNCKWMISSKWGLLITAWIVLIVGLYLCLMAYYYGPMMI